MMYRNSMHGFERYGFNGFIGQLGPWGILIIIGITILTISIIMLLIHSKKGNNSDDKLLNILKEKYVNGEINEEEYLSKKNIIGK